MTIQNAIPVLGSFSYSSAASGTTAATILVQPYPGPAGAPPYIYNALASYVPLTSAKSATKANWLQAPSFGVAHIGAIQS